MVPRSRRKGRRVGGVVSHRQRVCASGADAPQKPGALLTADSKLWMLKVSRVWHERTHAHMAIRLMVQTEIRWRIKRSCTEPEWRRASPQRRRRVWLTWPSLKNTTSTCAGRPGVLCRAPSQHHQRRPVTESFSLPINPPGAAGTDSVLVSFHVTAADLCLPRCGVGC